MAIAHAGSGEVVDVRPFGPALSTAGTRTVLKSAAVEIIRLVLPAGKEIPTHRAKGELVVQCVEGKVAFTALGRTHELVAGYLIHLATGEPHSVLGIEDGSLLLTILLPNQ